MNDDFYIPDEPELLPATRLAGLTPTWDKRLPLEVALGIDDLDTILLRHDLTRERWEVLSEHPAFRRELAGFMKDLRENGYGFEQKCKVMAEAYLEELDKIVADDGASPEVKLKTVQSIVKWARLEADPEEGKNKAANMVQININI